jgi:large subunit ribosomal protein L25
MSKSYLKQMRRHARVPANLYGKEKATLPLEVALFDLAQALKTDAGVHAIIDLKIEGAKRGEGGTAVIKKIQKDTVARKVLHVEFQRVSLSDTVVTAVPVEMLGEAPGVREGGVLEQVITELDVKSRADQIPIRLEVDISGLNIGDFIHASEVSLPEGVELAHRPEDIVVALRPPHIHALREEAAEAEEEEVLEAEGVQAEESIEEES